MKLGRPSPARIYASVILYLLNQSSPLFLQNILKKMMPEHSFCWDIESDTMAMAKSELKVLLEKIESLDFNFQSKTTDPAKHMKNDVILPRRPDRNGSVIDFCMPIDNPMLNFGDFVKKRDILKTTVERTETKIVMIYGSSGAGKTTMACSLARDFYVVYASYGSGVKESHGDGSSTLLSKLIDSKSDDIAAKNALCLDLFIRLFMLYVLLVKYPDDCTPINWLYLQISEKVETRQINELFLPLITNTKYFSEINENAHFFCAHLSDEIFKITNKTVVLCRDECQYICRKKFGKFKDGKYDLLQFSTSVFADIDIKQILLGTYLHMGYGKAIAEISGIGKPASGAYQLFTDFPFYSPDQVLEIFDSFFDTSRFNDELKSEIKSLYGRARNIGGFVTFLVRQKSTKMSLETFISKNLHEFKKTLIIDFSRYLSTTLDDIGTIGIVGGEICSFLKHLFKKEFAILDEATDMRKYGILPLKAFEQVDVIGNEMVGSYNISVESKLEFYIMLGIQKYLLNAHKQTVFEYLVIECLKLNKIADEIGMLVHYKLCELGMTNLMDFINKLVDTDGFNMPEWLSADKSIEIDSYSKLVDQSSTSISYSILSHEMNGSQISNIILSVELPKRGNKTHKNIFYNGHGDLVIVVDDDNGAKFFGKQFDDILKKLKGKRPGKQGKFNKKLKK